VKPQLTISGGDPGEQIISGVKRQLCEEH